MLTIKVTSNKSRKFWFLVLAPTFIDFYWRFFDEKTQLGEFQPKIFGLWSLVNNFMSGCSLPWQHCNLQEFTLIRCLGAIAKWLEYRIRFFSCLYVLLDLGSIQLNRLCLNSIYQLMTRVEWGRGRKTKKSLKHGIACLMTRVPCENELNWTRLQRI